MTNEIKRSIEISAPVSRVWRALTDHREFGKWFGVVIDAPFEVGKMSTGHIAIEGYEHVRWESLIEAIEPERRFVYAWRPYAVDPERDYTHEPRTVVTFLLEPSETGTRLTVTEAGFDAIPKERRDEALRMNTGGWEAQIENIRAHVSG